MAHKLAKGSKFSVHRNKLIECFQICGRVCKIIFIFISFHYFKICLWCGKIIAKVKLKSHCYLFLFYSFMISEKKKTTTLSERECGLITQGIFGYHYFQTLIFVVDFCNISNKNHSQRKILNHLKRHPKRKLLF